MLRNAESACLEGVQAGILIVDSGLRLVLVNGMAREILGLTSGDPVRENTCHSLLIGSPVPCAGCPLGMGCTPGSLNKQRVHCRAPRAGERILQLFCFGNQDRRVLITLRDVSKEVRLIEEFAFLHKELHAKNILEKRKERALSDCRASLRILWDYFPDGLAAVKRDYTLIESNRFFQHRLGGQGKKKCYELLGFSVPCPNCPAENSFQAGTMAVIGHRMGEEYLTENFVPLAEEQSALLVFRDSTRQVQLIEKIREQRQTIQSQKDLFMNLTELMGLMQREADAAKVAESFMSAVFSQLDCSAGVLLVEGLRRGNLWLTLGLGLSEGEVQAFAGEYLRLPLRRLDVVTVAGEVLPAERGPWFQVPLRGSENRQIGIFAVNMRPHPQMQQQLSLYCDPMSSYLYNRLLTLKLEQRANTDGLTGLFNRSYLERALNEEKQKAARYAIPFAVIIADLNGLKPVNDNYGHQAGDALIIAAAESLASVCRDTDVVARIGGDEFCVLSPRTGQAGGEALASRLRAHIQEQSVFVENGPPLPVSLSLGVAASDTVPADQVMDQADQNMYHDKEEHYRTMGRRR